MEANKKTKKQNPRTKRKNPPNPSITPPPTRKETKPFLIFSVKESVINATTKLEAFAFPSTAVKTEGKTKQAGKFNFLLLPVLLLIFQVLNQKVNSYRIRQ